MIPCPKCRVPLAELGAEGRFTAVCGRCRFTWLVLEGRVRRRGSQVVTKQRPTEHHHGVYVREYELDLTLPNGEREPVRFGVPGREDGLRVQQGDDARVYFTMRGGEREDLVEILNRTTDERTVIGSPGGKAFGAAMAASALTGLVVFLALFFGTDVSFLASLGAGLGAVVVLGAALNLTMTPRVDKASAVVARAAARQQALVQKRELMEARRAHLEDKGRKVALRERLRALQEKMRGVGEALYGARIATMGRAIAVLDEQIALDEELASRYGKLITIIEIEQEAAGVSEDLPEDVAAAMSAKLDELRALEDRSQQIEDELAANDEVTRMLAS